MNDKLPFCSTPWRRSLYVLLSAPLNLISLLDGGRLRRRLGGRLLGGEIPARRLRGLPGLPFDLAAALVVLYGWSVVPMNLAYPLRPLIGFDGSLENAWGGPTLLGAWAVHALGGLVFLFLMPWVVDGLVAVQRRILGASAG
ncbi:hypothetical protein [Actinocorallia populi]|uniref:hypothetical protein n=1 Tax=Actinocorallia populi TaxID=2079200 RepID=UPI000D086D1D|nr:hypothetical protein [Actinocorallia populi]